MTLHLAAVNVVGWKCFRAPVELRLQPKPYAIVARYEGEADRSNWAGKTSLLQAIHYGLYGALPDDIDQKDDVITRGESKAEVQLALSTGARVVRTKGRGRSEKLWYYPPDGKALIGEAAQQAVVQALGLTADDFVNTSYFRQREMARFLLQRASARLETVSGWLRLAPLERAEEVARQRFGRCVTELDRLARDLQWCHDDEAELRRALGTPPEQDVAATLDALIAQHEAALATARHHHELAVHAGAAAAEAAHLQATRTQYDAVVREGTQLANEVAAEQPPLAQLQVELQAATQLRDELRTQVNESDAELRRRSLRVAQGFDGQCPVTCNLCPVAADVNRQTEAMQALHDVEHARNLELGGKFNAAADRVATVGRAVRTAEERRRRLQALRDLARSLKPTADRAAQLAPAAYTPGDAPALLATVHEHERTLAGLRHQVAHVREVRARAALLATQVEAARATTETAREALLVFGKNGAQRRVAERALDQIGADATVLLRESGVPLEVGLRWSRHGKDPASSCADCGTPFPKTARVKECERCGAARGPKLVHELDVVLSDRSGAAEDLAAFALQMSASRWLRRERGAAWGVLLLDEPTGQLDAANRRALTAHLARAFARAAVDQALVVAHHASVLDALPGKVEIVAGAGGSRATVVA